MVRLFGLGVEVSFGVDVHVRSLREPLRALDPVLCQNSALLKQTINQQRSVCVCDRTKGRRLYDRLVSKNTNKLKTRNSKNL